MAKATDDSQPKDLGQEELDEVNANSLADIPDAVETPREPFQEPINNSEQAYPPPR